MDKIDTVKLLVIASIIGIFATGLMALFNISAALLMGAGSIILLFAAGIAADCSQ